MRMTVRRYRRRRTGSDSPGSTHSPFALPFFDRLEYLSQSINQTRKTDAPFIVLVTQDNFFRSGFLSGHSPLSNCCDYSTLEAALSDLNQWPSSRLVVDVESRASPLIDLLDRLRRHSLFAPYLTPYLLIRADDYDTRLFCKAAGPFHVLERQLTPRALQQTLLEAPSPAATGKSGFHVMNGRSCRRCRRVAPCDRLLSYRTAPIAALFTVSAASWRNLG